MDKTIATRYFSIGITRTKCFLCLRSRFVSNISLWKHHYVVFNGRYKKLPLIPLRWRVLLITFSAPSAFCLMFTICRSALTAAALKFNHQPDEWEFFRKRSLLPCLQRALYLLMTSFMVVCALRVIIAQREVQGPAPALQVKRCTSRIFSFQSLTPIKICVIIRRKYATQQAQGALGWFYMSD